ncbi:iron complex outermembrane receptor protein [Rhodoblastus acidophilus]|uniref:TonB-dependent receptor n=1 Tax=Rhodoblastus acidophilus TaxID=1074 RepID=UPI0022250E00|nr:TonB-dependent siderophore receptor [Rhodoblastus acidophilus]MCW2285798.1 iron complex outermembrane receptor protein [Rhodoblastus acidophilus]MCW2333379.1 iron complex outermembrane receptor protein [Rhodoblastus acidophilus]
MNASLLSPSVAVRSTRASLLLATALLTCHGASAQEAAQGVPPIDVNADLTAPASTPAGAPRVDGAGKPMTGTVEDGYRQTYFNMGPLGERKALDLPFSVHTIPEAIITNQDVQTFSELTKYIPSLQQQGHPGLEFGPPVIRGLVADDSSANTRIDGMNVRGDTQLPFSLYQSFEVLTGPSGAFYGFTYPAGTLNGILKRPTAQPMMSATVGYISNARPEVSIDFGGPIPETNGVLGYRLNLLHSDGQSFVAGSDVRRDVLGLGVDITPTPDTKIELNANRYRYEQAGLPAGFAYKGGVVKLPAALDPTKQGYGQSWSALIAQTDITDAKLIHRFNEDWRLEAGILRQEADRWFENRLTNTLNGNGTYKATYSSSGSLTTVVSNIFNINGVVYTGPLKHELVLGTNGFRSDAYSLPSSPTYTLSSKIPLYDPIVFPTYVPNAPGPKYLSSTIVQQSLVQNDTVHFNDQWSLMLGLAESWIDNTNYASASPHNQQSQYVENGVPNPVTALTFKPREDVTTYVSYSSSVQSDIAPATGVKNPNEALKPLRSTQYEGGAKASLPGVDVSSALFYIVRPYSATDTDGYFKNLGNQDDLGAEFTLRGKVTDDLTLVGGVTWLDTKLADMKGANAVNNGNQVVGIPRWQTSLLAEYAVPQFHGLTGVLNLHYTGQRAADAENFSWAAAYFTTDIGARYQAELAGQKLTFRAMVENVFNEKYWASINGDMSGANGANNTAYLGAPRTYKASLSWNF